ncbi:von willebrand factor a domain-containing protein 5a [Anaeramoeba flamelloides]|uniref:von willebrand factor a domain-containing protein 5a n=1 Tax=Anaeramoeba flamelloides TaxID=1746091 RepID=A0ABQ8YZW0_9EUKA|nr:von willebrand factor a domain-containing protein 5a [Anaeramoeba flamelloides]
MNHKYQNNETVPIETVFVFPLDSKSAVNHFEVFLDGKKIKGVVKEKKQAKEEYENAIKEGKTAVKMEQEMGDVFKMNVGNLKPDKCCIITLKYVTNLESSEDSKLTFYLPQALAPRFVPMESQEEFNKTEFSKVKYSKRVPYGTTYTFQFDMNSKIEAISSTSHGEFTPTIEGTKANGTYKASRQDDFGKDFKIDIALEKPHEPRVLLERYTYPAIETGDPETVTTAMLSFYPDLEEQDVKTEIIFLIDRSGSMSGKRIDNVSKVLNVFLPSLPETCFFNIVGFGSTYEFLFPNGSVQYNNQNLKTAKEHALGIQADLGGTQIAQPLQEIFNQPTKRGYSRQIFLLTDGSVGNTRDVIDTVKREAQTTRVFTFGIGSGASTALVEGVAKAGNGACEMIADNDPIRKIVLRQLNRALKPSITNLEVQFIDGLSQPNLLAPFRIPPVFAGKRVLIFLFFDESPQKIQNEENEKENEKEKEKEKVKKLSNGSVALKGAGPNGDVEFILPINFTNEIQEGTMIASLASKCMITEIENSNSQYHEKTGSIKSNINQDFLNKEIVKLSTRFQVISKLTAFIAVVENENENENENEKEELKEKPQLRIVEVQASNLTKSSMGSHGVRKSWKCDGEGGGGGGKVLRRMLKIKQSNEKKKIKMSKKSPQILKDRDKYSKKPLSRVRKQSERRSESRKLNPFDELIDLQLASGKWELSQKLMSLLKVTKEKITQNCPENLEIEIWTVLLVIAFIQMTYKDTKDEWELLVNKAKKWIKKNSQVDIVKLLEKAKICF